MKYKIAFIKFAGMAFGGTEKVLQTIASELPKNIYKVDFFYCDAAPYLGSDYKHINTDNSRIKYCLENDVNLIKFNVEYKDIGSKYHDWINTDFWNHFNENDYDVIITGRGGYPEYPFNKINNTKIIDTIHLSGFAENKINVYKSVLLSTQQKEKWIKAGGPKEKATIIPNPVSIVKTNKKFDTGDKFVFGMHQRDDDFIFSPIPLEAYKMIETSDTLFMMLGGSQKYKNQAKALGIKNIKFIETTAKLSNIHQFLNSLNVYSHGRQDGEQCSTAIIEAMSHGLPVISHTAPSMGQAEQISNAGIITKDKFEYSKAMEKIMTNRSLHSQYAENSLERYNSIYSLNAIMEKYISLIQEVISTPNVNNYQIFINKIQNLILYLRVTLWKVTSKKVLKKILYLFKKSLRKIGLK